ncbi:MAG: ribulokinase [Bacillota bacterium]
MRDMVIGIDFGTDSVRSIVISAATGEELASDTAWYKRWLEGSYSDPAKNQFRHHPLDYIESLEASVAGALRRLPPGAARHIAGIGIDTTGSTPCAADKSGRPLALAPGLAENPNAIFLLWKDHTAVGEAQEINQAAKTWGGTDFTKYEGGVYSSEWFWAKILHVLREDAAVREAAYTWIELCDWIPALLTGNENPALTKRSRCAAGHKAMWHSEWGGLPPEVFLTKLDPLVSGLRERLYTQTYISNVRAGELTAAWAARLGLEPGIAVAVGAFDAHMGAVGVGITPATLVKIIGTSNCDIMVADKEMIKEKLIGGICGQVDGSVIPGMVGLEAGQSAFGDVYAWFRDLLAWPLSAILPETTLLDQKTAAALEEEIKNRILTQLSREAAAISIAETGLIALDWFNGRRTPYADQTLKGALVGLTLGSNAPKIFRALVEATAFGARAINERFMEEGLAIKQVIALGGIAKKNDLVMQITADVLGMPIKIAASEQACALGAAIFGAVAAGLHDQVETAQQKMGSGIIKTFLTDARNTEMYNVLYQRYLEAGEALTNLIKKI